jgi:hypothetical protein
MAVGLKPLRSGEVVDRPDDVALELRRQREVDDLPAVDAEEVVVVLGQVLRQLEARELVMRRDPPYESRRFEVDEVSVGGAAWEIRDPFCDLGNAHWLADADEKFDDRPSAMGIALIGSSESCLNHCVKVVVDLVSSHAASLLSWALTAIAINMMAHSHTDGRATNSVPRFERGPAIPL